MNRFNLLSSLFTQHVFSDNRDVTASINRYVTGLSVDGTCNNETPTVTIIEPVLKSNIFVRAVKVSAKLCLASSATSHFLAKPCCHPVVR